MLERCGEEIDFESLASSLGITYRSFRYLFAKETGTSPLQYHLSVKLSRAKNLLKYQDKKTHMWYQLTALPKEKGNDQRFDFLKKWLPKRREKQDEQDRKD